MPPLPLPHRLASGPSAISRLAPALFAASTLLVACGPGGNPFTSFETRCAKLALSRFEVVAVPLTFERDDTQPIAALTAKSGSSPATHRAIGLTTAVFGQSTDIELRVVDDRRDALACGTPRVHVELSMQPVTVFVASELADAPCQRAITLSHEMKHVEVFREVLDEAAQDLERELPEGIGTELQRAKSPEELQQRLIVRVRDFLAQFMDERQRALDERQAAVDSPEEYARVSTACRRSVADLNPGASANP
jgi:hypothetical protein